jgi:hypothetical protein
MGRLKKYHTKEENKEAKKVARKKYVDNNKEKKIEANNIYKRNRKKTDSLFKITQNIKTLISNSFKKYKFKKTSKTANILGCTFDEFKTHLESKFELWMNWDNHGLYNGTEMFGWDIDHIIPLSYAVTEDDIIKLNHYSNLQPLCSKINRDVKRNK